jgi:hypothetical protein
LSTKGPCQLGGVTADGLKLPTQVDIGVTGIRGQPEAILLDAPGIPGPILAVIVLTPDGDTEIDVVPRLGVIPHIKQNQHIGGGDKVKRA